MNGKILVCLLLGSLLLSTQVLANQSYMTNQNSNKSASSMQHNQKDDEAITNGVKKLINNSKTLSDLHVNVATTHGIVSLAGTVDSNSQATSLVELAQSIVGVTDVDTSKLIVKDSQQPMTDSYITAKAKALFLREKLFGDKDISVMGISVETQNGVVYLTGHINNKQQIKNAIKILEGIKGVKKVEYNVKKITPVTFN